MFTPETAFNGRQSVRLAVMTALQELPTRQRAVLILRDVVQFSAAEWPSCWKPRPPQSTVRCSGPGHISQGLPRRGKPDRARRTGGAP